MLALQYPFRPEEDYSSSWKLVYNTTRCTVPENTSLFQHGHFSRLCYRKRDGYDKKRSLDSRSPKAHQLHIGSIYTQDSICDQSEESSSDNPFCLQVQLKSSQVETRIQVPQHIIANLASTLKPNQKKTQYLRTRLDTCADINIMPVSVHKLVCKDLDGKKLAPSCKLQIGTYTTDKIKVIWSCTLFAVHPDTQLFKRSDIHFYKPWRQCCIILCNHSWIKLDTVPKIWTLLPLVQTWYQAMWSLKEERSQKNMPASKPSQNMCPTKEQFHTVLTTQNHIVNQHVVYEDQDKTGKWECQVNVISLCNDKKCQSTLCYEKKCQEPNVCIYSQWSQQWNPNKCSQLNQQYYNLITRKE